MKNPFLIRPAYLALAMAFIGFTAPVPAQVPVGVVPRSFEGTGLLTGEIDGEGNVSLHRFGGGGSLESVSLPEGLSRAFEASQAGAKPASGATTSAENPAPSVLSGTLPTGTMTEGAGEDVRQRTFVLGSGSKIIEIAQGDIVARIERNAAGLVTKLELPSGHQFAGAYDENGNLISTEDLLNGAQTLYVYDPVNNRPVQVVFPDGGAVVADNDAHGNPTSWTSPEGRRIQATYGAFGLLESLVDFRGKVSAFEYGPDGNLERFLDGEGAGQRIFTFSRDASGRIASAQGPEGQSLSYEYGPSGNVAAMTGLDGHETRLEEDRNGAITALVRPGGSRHTFTYDGLGRLASYTAPGRPTRSFHYNGHSEPVSSRVAGQEVVAFAYNGHGQLASSSESVPEGDPLTLSYAYDPLTGHLTQATSSDGVNLVPHHVGEAMTGLTWSGVLAGSLSLVLDEDYGIESQQVNAEPAILFTYDRDGMVASAGEMIITREPGTGLVTGIDVGVVSEVFDYNAFSELVSQQAFAGGVELFSASYVRDQIGRVTELVETVSGISSTITFSYVAGRIATVTRNGVVTETYGYDNRGNLTTDQLNGTYVYDGADQLLSAGAWSFTYTDTGERRACLNAGVTKTTYRYTPLGTLLRVDFAGGNSIRYLHDGAASRAVRFVDGSFEEAYLCPALNFPIASLDPQGAVIDRYVYAFPNEAPGYILRHGTIYRIITDHLGSVRMVVNASNGAVVQVLSYDAYGMPLQDSSPGFQPFGFAGGWTDQHTGFVRFGARDFDPRTRRWSTPNPIGFGSGSPNTYTYVRGGDPVNTKDASGLTVDISALDNATFSRFGFRSISLYRNAGGSSPVSSPSPASSPSPLPPPPSRALSPRLASPASPDSPPDFGRLIGPGCDEEEEEEEEEEEPEYCSPFNITSPLKVSTFDLKPVKFTAPEITPLVFKLPSISPLCTSKLEISPLKVSPLKTSVLGGLWPGQNDEGVWPGQPKAK